jgi:hypothetical protein
MRRPEGFIVAWILCSDEESRIGVEQSKVVLVRVVSDEESRHTVNLPNTLKTVDVKPVVLPLETIATEK